METFLKQIADNYALYIPIILAIIGLIKYVRVAIEKQKLLIEEFNKFQELVTIALADKYIDNEELREILIGLQKCKDIGMDTLDAYKDAYDKLVELIGKFKVKRLRAERRQVK